MSGTSCQRFKRTLCALQDCCEHLNDQELTESALSARQALIVLCDRVARSQLGLLLKLQMQENARMARMYD